MDSVKHWFFSLFLFLSLSECGFELCVNACSTDVQILIFYSIILLQSILFLRRNLSEILKITVYPRVAGPRYLILPFLPPLWALWLWKEATIVIFCVCAGDHQSSSYSCPMISAPTEIPLQPNKTIISTKKLSHYSYVFWETILMTTFF